MELLAKFIVLRGFWVPEITLDPTRLERGKRFVTDGLADGSLKPIIAKTFPLEEIVEAHRYLEVEPADRQGRREGVMRRPHVLITRYSNSSQRAIAPCGWRNLDIRAQAEVPSARRTDTPMLHFGALL
jgi:hypothetical protein